MGMSMARQPSIRYFSMRAKFFFSSAMISALQAGHERVPSSADAGYLLLPKFDRTSRRSGCQWLSKKFSCLERSRRRGETKRDKGGSLQG
eukprot:763494-Hanusia_phi.AAC.3